ncbi:MAG: DCC1-like thiol-disulfide oxidoreductase family protein [Acidimicrobiales bacterium]
MRAQHRSTQLTVLYDEHCALCRRCRSWIESQAQLVPIRFVPASTPAVAEWAAGHLPVGDELVVVDEVGQVWVGPDAFITCLWALRRYRGTARRLQAPGLRRFAKETFHQLFCARATISRVMGGDDDIICDGGGCGISGLTPHS